MRATRYLARHWQLLALTAAILALWSLPVIWPLKILVIFLHETSHGAAAILTGGTVVEMALSPLAGGHAITRGGNLFVIISAGYLGSLILGMALFFVAVRTRLDRWVMAGFGLVVIAVTLSYMRGTFPLVFGTVTGAALLACARFLARALNDLILRVVGLTSMIYVPYDIFSDTLARAHARSDARILAETFGGPTMFWGALWLVLALAAIYLSLRHGLPHSSNIAFARNAPHKPPRA